MLLARKEEFLKVAGGQFSLFRTQDIFISSKHLDDEGFSLSGIYHRIFSVHYLVQRAAQLNFDPRLQQRYPELSKWMQTTIFYLRYQQKFHRFQML